jgi:hypothetical protein
VVEFQTAALSVGSHSITARLGDNNNSGANLFNLNPSTSTVVVAPVRPNVRTDTTLVSSPNPSTVGRGVRFTATVTGGGATPTGIVSFRDGGTEFGRVNLVNGVAEFTTTTLAQGSRAITAFYEGSDDYAFSTSNTLTQQVTLISFSPPNLPSGTVAVAYPNTNISVTGTASGLVTFTVASGALPRGLILSPSASPLVVLSGTPQEAGTFAFRLRATDVNGNFGEQDYSIFVAGPVLTLLPASMPNGTAATAYPVQALLVSGGVAPYAFSLTGNLPPGLMLANGQVTGTPTRKGSYNFRITAQDSSQPTAFSTFVDYAVTIAGIAPGSFSLSSSRNPSVLGGAVTFRAEVRGTGGAPTGDIVFRRGGTEMGRSALSGGVASLTVTNLPAGTSNITAEYAGDDVYDAPAPAQMTQQVAEITIAPSSMPDGRAGVPYSQTITAGGVAGPFTFSSSGALPPGVSLRALNATQAVLEGTPGGAGVFNFNVIVTTPQNDTATRPYTLNVASATLAISPGSVPAGVADGGKRLP